MILRGTKLHKFPWEETEFFVSLKKKIKKNKERNEHRESSAFKVTSIVWPFFAQHKKKTRVSCSYIYIIIARIHPYVPDGITCDLSGYLIYSFLSIYRTGNRLPKWYLFLHEGTLPGADFVDWNRKEMLWCSCRSIFRSRSLEIRRKSAGHAPWERNRSIYCAFIRSLARSLTRPFVRLRNSHSLYLTATLTITSSRHLFPTLQHGRPERMRDLPFSFVEKLEFTDETRVDILQR